MATADLITSFLSNEMSPDQEREFLLSVAASDSMRLELKSHVMLDRILDTQAREATVPGTVRNLILAEAGITTVADGRSGSSSPALRGSGSFMSRITRGALVIALAATGFAAGYFTGDEAAQPATTSSAFHSVPTVSDRPVPITPVPLEGMAAGAVRAVAAVTSPVMSTSSQQSPSQQSPRLETSRQPMHTAAASGRSIDANATQSHASTAEQSRSVPTTDVTPTTTTPPAEASSPRVDPSASVHLTKRHPNEVDRSKADGPNN